MDMWYPHTRSANKLNNQRFVFFSTHGVAHFMPHNGMVPWHLPKAK
jgi:hypothetical protein